MKLSSTLLTLFLSAGLFAQEKIVVTQNIRYDGHESCVLDMAQPVSDSHGARPAIVIVHGGGWAAGDKRDAVYTFDFPNGSVNSWSGNDTVQMSISDEKNALNEIVAYFRKQKDVDKSRIVLIGESQGGPVSALSASELKNQVSGLMLIYPALCIPDNWNARYPSEEDIPEVSEMWGVRLGRKFMTDIHPMKPYETIGAYKGPVLIIHGTDDMVVPLEYSERAARTYGNATLKVIDKAGHGFKPAERKLSNEYVREFLSE